MLFGDDLQLLGGVPKPDRLAPKHRPRIRAKMIAAGLLEFRDEGANSALAARKASRLRSWLPTVRAARSAMVYSVVAQGIACV